MKKLNNIIGRVSREVPRDATHMTLDGHEEYTKFKCVGCEEMFLVGEAYLQSKKRRKNDNDIRPFCAICYIDTNGKRPDKQPVNAVATFILE
jgi:hypothetical protein